MKKIFAVIILLLFIVLLWFTKTRYNTCCDNTNSIKKEEPSPVLNSKPTMALDAPLVFQWGKKEAITNRLWDAERTKIMSQSSDGKILQITAPYFEEEGEALGILRAKSAFEKLQSADLKDVKYKAKLVEFYDKAKTVKFAKIDFVWLVQNENIQEIDNKALIYFPTNSSKKISNQNIITYLKNVAKTIKNSDKKIKLSGHSDNVGDALFNKRLALVRANSIKEELIRLGVDKSQISTISYGEEQPIADNKTASGRQKNRRVELEIK